MSDADGQEPSGSSKDEGRQHPRGKISHPEMHYPFGAPPRPEPPPSVEAPATEIARKILIAAAITIGTGILLGSAFAIHAWLTSSPSGPYNLGPATSDAHGLTGNLFTEWDNKLVYRLTIGPGSDEQHAGFALAVSNPPRPISFDIQIKDPLGFVLCSKNILLKYAPSNAAVLAASDQAPPAEKTDARTLSAADRAAQEQAAQAAALAQLQAQEAARERGKDLFQTAIGPDGQIASINAQGDMPCSEKAYERAASWSFSTDFPALAEQAELLKHQAETQADAARLARRAEAARRRAKRRAMASPLHFSMEGDDAVSWSDASLGVIGTEGGRTFLIDDRSRQYSGWQAFPAHIHYKCDQNAACTITRAGSAAVLHARLRR